MDKLNVVFFGTPEFVTPLVKTLSDNFQLVSLVTTPDQIIGRDKILTSTPTKKYLMNSSFQGKIFTPENLSDELVNQLKKLKPDLFVVAAYGKIIPEAILNLPKYGSINIHPSLLPKYRGATPIQSAILAGDKVTGVTFILMDSKMDHGPIIYQKTFKLTSIDNNESLHNKLFQHSAEVLPDVVRGFISSKILPKEQNHSQATFCKPLLKENGYFEINAPPSTKELDRMIKAYYPWPTAWTKWSPSAKAAGDKNEKIIKFYPEGYIQMEGKQKTKLADFIRGYPDFPIKKLD